MAIVPHTHWDREWYSPFQTFRIRLVKLLDVLLPMLERDLSYTRFLLDGQTAVLDDYLEGGLDPEMRAALEAHLAGCDGCTTYLEQLKAAVELARQTGERTLPPSLEQELIKAFGNRYRS